MLDHRPQRLFQGHPDCFVRGMTRSEYGRAFEEGFHPTVRFIVSKGLPPDAAEEVAQAAWTRGWERIDQLRDRDAIKTWINTIALNILRRNTHTESRTEPLSDHAAKPDFGVASVELEILLDSCGPSDRVLLLHQLHGLTTSEMARAVGVTETAVRLRLMRARRSARSLLHARV
jgi:RNA polymerase sigma-70 factor (ECF subfamily)